MLQGEVKRTCFAMQGIKIVDAESKKRAIQKLNADSKEHKMEIDEPVKKRKPTKKVKQKKTVDAEASAMQE